MTNTATNNELTFAPASIERAVVKYLAAIDERDRLQAAGGPEWGWSAEAREAARAINRAHGGVQGAATRAKVFTSYEFWDKMIARKAAHKAAQAAPVAAPVAAPRNTGDKQADYAYAMAELALQAGLWQEAAAWIEKQRTGGHMPYRAQIQAKRWSAMPKPQEVV